VDGAESGGGGAVVSPESSRMRWRQKLPESRETTISGLPAGRISGGGREVVMIRTSSGKLIYRRGEAVPQVPENGHGGPRH
jgi:hypothetical protein